MDNEGKDNPTNPTNNAVSTQDDVLAALGAAAPSGSDGGRTDPGDGGADARDVGGSDSGRDHGAAVYNGRLGAAMRENNELKRQLAEERAKYEKLAKEAEAAKKAVDFSDVKGYDELEETSRGAVEGMIRKATDAIGRRFEEKLSAMEGERRGYEERMRRETYAKAQDGLLKDVDGKWPGLIRRVGSGDLADAWQRFCATEDPITGTTFGRSLSSATGRGAVSAAARVFGEFVRANRLEGQFNAASLAEPSRGAAPGGARSDATAGGQVWQSREAILAEMQKVQQRERQGLIDRATRQKQMNALEDAFRSGRFLK